MDENTVRPRTNDGVGSKSSEVIYTGVYTPSRIDVASQGDRIKEGFYI